MTRKLIDLSRYKKAKNAYEKLLKRDPYTFLTFADFLKVREFLEEVHKNKMIKSQEEEDK